MTKKTGAPQAGTKTRLFYGYVIVAAAFVIMAIAWGIFNAYGIFFTSFLEEFGWSRATISGPFSIALIVYGVMGFVVGIFNDRFGPRVVITVCGIIVGAGFMLMSRVTALWQLYLFLGILAGIGMSGVWVPQLSTVARWFRRRRTLMSGIVISGVSIGGLVAPVAITRLIEAADWRTAYLILGGLLLVVMVAAAQFQRRHPADMGLKPYGDETADENAPAGDDESFTFGQSVRTAQFWVACMMFFCLGFCLFSVLVHIVPHATDLGIQPIAAAGILSLAGGLAIIGNYTLGGLADKIGNRWIFIIGFILMAAAYLWLLTAGTLWMFYIFAVIYAMAHGGLGASESPLVAGLFGVRSHGLIYGVVHIGFTIGAALGPLLTGYIYDTTGSYRTAFIICGAIAILGILLTVILRPVGKQAGRI